MTSLVPEGQGSSNTMTVGQGQQPVQMVVHQPVEEMKTQMVVVEQPQPVQVIVVAQPQAQVQVQPQPRQSTTLPVSENTYFQSNNVVNDKRKEFMVASNVGYFRVRPEVDHLDEMKPWETDGQNYSFACCTEYFGGGAAAVVLSTEQTGKGQRRESLTTAIVESSDAQTVYHKTNTEMLTILTKGKSATESTFDFTSKKSMKYTWIVFALFFVVGLLLFIGGGGGGYIGGGVACWVIAILIVVVVKCKQKKPAGSSLSSSQDVEINSFSIPIYCVTSVKRKATMTHSKSSSSVQGDCDCCGAEPARVNEEKDDMCVVTIYYRMVAYTNAEGHGVEDSIELKLSVHQGFNLQRYLNCVIDGCHPNWKSKDVRLSKYQLELKPTN